MVYKKIIFIWLMLLLSGCKEEVKINSFDFKKGKIEISFNKKVKVSSVEVFENKDLITTFLFPSPMEKIFLKFNWEQRKKYQIVINLRNGKKLTRNFSPPELNSFNFDFQLPFGAKGESLVVKGSKISGLVFLENLKENKITSRILIKLSSCFKLIELPESFKAEYKEEKLIIKGKILLACKYDNFNGIIRLEVPKGLKCGYYPIYAEAKVEGKKYSRNFQIKVSDLENLGKVKIEKILLPTDEEGKFDKRKIDGYISIEGGSFLKRVLRGKKEYYFPDIPVAYHAIFIKNDLKEDVAVVAKSNILNPKTREVVDAFRLPPHSSPTGDAYTIINAKGEEESLVTFPVYVRPYQILGGEYLLYTTLKILGTDKIISELEKKIYVIKKNRIPAIITSFAFSLTIGFFIYIILFYQKLFSKFKTEWIVLISLFGSTSFTTVNVPGTILWDFIHAILGPFSFLITGFFYGIVLYTLIIALLVLIPKPGVVTLIIFIRFLLQGLVFGNFSPVSLMWKVTLAILLEISLFTFGITRGELRLNKKSFLIAGMASGIADSLSSYINFQTLIFLYRLFYANWYIIAYCIINGFIYTFIGAIMGMNIGSKLKRIVG